MFIRKVTWPVEKQWLLAPFPRPAWLLPLVIAQGILKSGPGTPRNVLSAIAQGWLPNKIFSSQNSQQCLWLPPQVILPHVLSKSSFCCASKLFPIEDKEKSRQMMRSSCFIFLCGTQPCQYLLALFSSPNAHSSHSCTYNSSEPKPSEAVREQGPRLTGDQIRIHNGIISLPSLYNPALCAPRQAFGSHQGRGWEVGVSHILLNASVRPVPSQNSYWLRNSFIVPVHPGVYHAGPPLEIY